MTWTQLGDIKRRYTKVTLVAGDLEVMRAWPGYEAAGFPDDEYELPAGEVMIFDLNLLQPIVFHADGAVRLLASFDDMGSKNVDEATLHSAVELPGSDEVWGAFEVESGALALVCADWPASELALASTDRPMVGHGFAVIPCPNGRYEVSQAASVEVAGAKLGRLITLTIRRAT